MSDSDINELKAAFAQLGFKILAFIELLTIYSK